MRGEGLLNAFERSNDECDQIRQKHALVQARLLASYHEKRMRSPDLETLEGLLLRNEASCKDIEEKMRIKKLKLEKGIHVKEGVRALVERCVMPMLEQRRQSDSIQRQSTGDGQIVSHPQQPTTSHGQLNQSQPQDSAEQRALGEEEHTEQAQAHTELIPTELDYRNEIWEAALGEIEQFATEYLGAESARALLSSLPPRLVRE